MAPIQLTQDQREQTTAATNLLLATLAGGYAANLLHLRADRWRTRVWTLAFGGLGVAAGVGAIVHGLQLGERAKALLWRWIYLTLGLVVALFAAGAIRDGWGPRAGRRALPLTLLAGLGFFAISQRVQRGFLVFVVYEASALLFALAVYVRLARNGQLAGAPLVAAGVLLSILAAAVQTTDWELNVFGLPFDHNGLFHLVQLTGLPLLVAGLRAGLSDAESSASR